MLVATIRHGLPHTGAGRAGRYTHREVGMQRVEWTPTEELERRVGVGPFRQAWTGERELRRDTHQRRGGVDTHHVVCRGTRERWEWTPLRGCADWMSLERERPHGARQG